jgi:hypothetical protein
MRRTALLAAGIFSLTALPAFGEGEITSVEDCQRYLEHAQTQSEPATTRLYAVQLTEDEWIERQLKRAIAQELELDGKSIAANVDDGTVTLGGSVQDEQNKARAIALARTIPGVEHVDADILWVHGAPERVVAASGDSLSTTDPGDETEL